MSEITRNKKQIQLFVASAIAIALVVSSISGILVAELYASNPYLFIASLVIALVLTALFSYELIASENMTRKIKSDYVFTFDRKNGKFIDIAHHAPSVHARVHWEKLSQEYKHHLITLDNPREYFGSDLNSFIDKVVQYYLVMIVIRNTGWRNKNYKEVTFKELPQFLKLSKTFESDKDSLFNLPSCVVLERETEDKPFIKAHTKYGTLSVKWSHSFSQTANRSKPFVISQTRGDADGYHDFNVEVACEYHLKHWKLLSAHAKEFHEWAEGIIQSIESSSWDISEKRLELYLLSQLFIDKSPNNKMQPSVDVSID